MEIGIANSGKPGREGDKFLTLQISRFQKMLDTKEILECTSLAIFTSFNNFRSSLHCLDYQTQLKVRPSHIEVSTQTLGEVEVQWQVEGQLVISQVSSRKA